MTGEGMTSVSVSYEIRRQLNTMRTAEQFRSVDNLIAQLMREHKLRKLSDEVQLLRERTKELADVGAEQLVNRLNLSPFKV